MEQVCARANLNQAYKRVKDNKGAPGIDGMSVDGLREWLSPHKDELLASLLDGTYQPQPVKGVRIPKPGGGMRQLGISHGTRPFGTTGFLTSTHPNP